jgi:hypothetical protein
VGKNAGCGDAEADANASLHHLGGRGGKLTPMHPSFLICTIWVKTLPPTGQWDTFWASTAPGLASNVPRGAPLLLALAINGPCSSPLGNICGCHSFPYSHTQFSWACSSKPASFAQFPGLRLLPEPSNQAWDFVSATLLWVTAMTVEFGKQNPYREDVLFWTVHNYWYFISHSEMVFGEHKHHTG